MDDHHPQIIIVKRRASHEDEHHGGAWKIAFADFMTAMMAFFLVLWIINATDKKTKTMIAHYFNPVKLEEATRTPKSIHGDGTEPAVDGGDAKDRRASGDVDSGESRKASDVTDGAASQIKGAAKPTPGGKSAAPAPVDPANPKPTMSEGVLFDDPYRSLDVIAGPASPDVRAIAQSQRVRGALESGSADPDAIRDPFRPIGREGSEEPLNADAAKLTPTPGAPSAKPEAATQSHAQPQSQAQPQTPSQAQSRTQPASESAKTERVAAPPSAASEPNAQKALAATAERIQKELELQAGAPGTSHLGPAIDVKATDEGLLISLTDRLNFSMFPIGSAEPQRQVVLAMDAVARTLKNHPGAIIVRGHTDGHPYKSSTYDNWRLSSARAQLAYYMLTRAGVPENRFSRIEGYADRKLRDPSHPFAAENRRIEILLQEPKP